MDRTKTHQQIALSISCQHKHAPCKPGFALIQKLAEAIVSAGDAIPEGFEISGTACVSSCERPCTLAYHGSREGTFLFGDVKADADIETLVSLTREQQQAPGGWDAAFDRPDRLWDKAQGPLPASVIALEPSREYLQ